LTRPGLAVAIDLHLASASLRRTIDVGVSYGLVAIVGVLAYRLRAPWRRWYLGIALAIFGGLAGWDASVTSWGHLLALAIGLASYPLAAERPRTSPRNWFARTSRCVGAD